MVGNMIRVLRARWRWPVGTHRRRRRRAAGPMRVHAASLFEIDPPVYSRAAARVTRRPGESGEIRPGGEGGGMRGVQAHHRVGFSSVASVPFHPRPAGGVAARGW